MWFYVLNVFHWVDKNQKSRSIGMQLVKLRFFKFVSTAESIMTKSPPV